MMCSQSEVQPLRGPELAAMSRRFGRMEPHEVIDAFRRAHENCRMTGDRLPSAASMQEMLVLWRLAQAWQDRLSGTRPMHRTTAACF